MERCSTILDDLPFIDPPFADYKSERQRSFDDEQRRVAELVAREDAEAVHASLIDFAEIDRILQSDLDARDEIFPSDLDFSVLSGEFPLEAE